MANKTLVEKAAEKVGYGLAMVEDVAGTAIGSVAKAFSKSPRKRAKKQVKKAARTTPTKKAAKKSAARKSPAKKAVPKKAAPKKAAKKPAKKATRSRR